MPALFWFFEVLRPPSVDRDPFVPSQVSLLRKGAVAHADHLAGLARTIGAREWASSGGQVRLQRRIGRRSDHRLSDTVGHCEGREEKRFIDWY